MALLEAAIFFQGDILIESKYYLHDYDLVFDETQKKTVIDAITNLASSAFGDNIQNFAMGDHVVFLTSNVIEIPQKGTDSKISAPIIMYCIAEKDTNKKLLTESMKTALFQFVNRFSFYDINSKNKDKFKDFTSRFEKIFKGLIKTEEEMSRPERNLGKNHLNRSNYGNTSNPTYGFHGKF